MSRTRAEARSGEADPSAAERRKLRALPPGAESWRFEDLRLLGGRDREQLKALGVTDEDVPWIVAIEKWYRRQPDELADLLEQWHPAPRFVMKFVARVIAGEVPPPKGTPPKVPTVGDRRLRAAIVRMYLRRRQALQASPTDTRAGTPSERAVSAVAARLRMDESTISKIVHPRAKKGR